MNYYFLSLHLRRKGYEELPDLQGRFLREFSFLFSPLSHHLCLIVDDVFFPVFPCCISQILHPQVVQSVLLSLCLDSNYFLWLTDSTTQCHGCWKFIFFPLSLFSQLLYRIFFFQQSAQKCLFISNQISRDKPSQSGSVRKLVPQLLRDVTFHRQMLQCVFRTTHREGRYDSIKDVCVLATTGDSFVE